MASIGTGDAAASMPHAIGNYRIERELGRGGMGAVYVGVHQLIGKRAAIKVLLPQVSQRADLVQRFFTEARAVGAIKHPGIVEVYDYGVEPDGNAYLVMEHLEGEPLSRRLVSHGRLHVPAAVALARQIAFALAAAHRAGIVHRDLKPDNVFVCPHPDGGEQAKLLDFGVAKLIDDAGPAGPTTVTGAILGTPAYMSPEQCEGSRVVDHRSDLYSLGCTLFVMLTGRLPFLETGIGGLIGAHLHTPPPALRDHCAAATPELAAIVARLLAKSPDDRFQTAEELAAALAAPGISVIVPPPRIAETPAAGGSIARVVQPPPAVAAVAVTRRRWWPLALAGVAVVAGAIAVVAWSRRDVEAPVARAPLVPESAGSSAPVAEVSASPASEPVVSPVPPVTRPPPLSLAAMHLELARDFAAKRDYPAVARELAELAKLSPEPAIVAAAAKLHDELAPAALAAAVEPIAALARRGRCAAAKAEAAAIAKQWGSSPQLARAATCKAVATTTSPPPVDPRERALDVLARFRAQQFAEVVALCRADPPDAAALYYACMVAACRAGNGPLAAAWMTRRVPTRTENNQITNALNVCLQLGVEVLPISRKQRVIDAVQAPRAP